MRVQEFTYGNDGSIPKLSMTGEAPVGIARLNPFTQVEAETIAFASGVKTETAVTLVQVKTLHKSALAITSK